MRYASIVLLLVSTFVGDVVLQDCTLDINKVNDNKMVFAVPKGDTFWPVQNDGNLKFKNGQLVELICADKSKTTINTAKCVSGSKFSIANKNVDLSKAPSYCSETPLESTTSVSGSNAKIGFQINKRFIKQLEISLDLGKKTTNYVKHTLKPGSYDATTAGDNIKFSESSRAFGISGTQIDNLYNKISVYNEMNRRLGIRVSRYFDTGLKGLKHLQRGHMAPQADFTYQCEQKATFSFLNAAPQFQALNTLNWKMAEANVRKYMKTQQLDSLVIYTGGSGVAKLPNSKIVDTKLYLQATDTFPVPEFYFKVIIDPNTRKGVALVGVNNPYVDQSKIGSYEICNKIITSHQFLPSSSQTIASGYMYACEVLDFNSKIGNKLPITRRDVKSLLS